MNRAAWDALTDLSSVSNITVELLSSPITPPESLSSLAAKKANGTVAGFGPPWLDQGDEWIPIRRLTVDILGWLTDENVSSVTIHGAALYYAGELVALVGWDPVVMTQTNDALVSLLDWTVLAYGGANP